MPPTIQEQREEERKRECFGCPDYWIVRLQCCNSVLMNPRRVYSYSKPDWCPRKIREPLEQYIIRIKGELLDLAEELGKRSPPPPLAWHRLWEDV